MKKLKVKEKELQKCILDWLKIKRYFCWKQNTTGIKKPDGSYIPTGLRGVADIIGILPTGRFFAIEVKGTGGKASPEQVIFLDNIRNNGGLAFVAYSVEEVINHFSSLI